MRTGQPNAEPKAGTSRRDASFRAEADRTARRRSAIYRGCLIAPLVSGADGAARRSCQARAFTLIELILVMALLVIVVGFVSPSLKNFMRGRTLDSEARRFLSLTRYAQSRAVSEGLPMTLWVDSREGTYGLQVQTGYVDLDRKAVEYEVDEALEVHASAPPVNALSVGRAKAALLANSVPAIRFSPDGFIDSTSPETIEFRESEEHSVWVTQSANRVSYEIAAERPATFRR